MPTALIWLSLSTLLTVMGFAGMQPLAATLMHGQGMSDGPIGAIMSLTYVGVLAMAPLQRWMLRRTGPITSYQIGKALTAAGFFMMIMAQRPMMWAIAMSFIGLGAGLTWPITDSLMAVLAPSDRKGAWMGAFQTCVGAVFVLGPWLAAMLETRPQLFFISAGTLGLFTSLPLLGKSVSTDTTTSSEGTRYRTLLLAAPALWLLALMGGFFEGTQTGITLIALDLKWSEAAGIALAGVIGAGSFVAQYPVGKLADRWGGMRVAKLILILLLVSSLPLLVCDRFPTLLWIVAFGWGIGGGSLYTLSMTTMAQRFTGAECIAGTSLIVMSYTLGAIKGPAFAGYAIEWQPLLGPLLLFAAASLVGLAMLRK